MFSKTKQAIRNPPRKKKKIHQSEYEKSKSSAVVPNLFAYLKLQIEIPLKQPEGEYQREVSRSSTQHGP